MCEERVIPNCQVFLLKSHCLALRFYSLKSSFGPRRQERFPHTSSLCEGAISENRTIILFVPYECSPSKDNHMFFNPHCPVECDGDA